MCRTKAAGVARAQHGVAHIAPQRGDAAAVGGTSSGIFSGDGRATAALIVLSGGLVLLLASANQPSARVRAKARRQRRFRLVFTGEEATQMLADDGMLAGGSTAVTSTPDLWKRAYVTTGGAAIEQAPPEPVVARFSV